MNCRGLCDKMRGLKPKNGKRYASGQKRCQVCDLFVVCDGLRCPCCNCMLRCKPRHHKSKFKESFMKEVLI